MPSWFSTLNNHDKTTTMTFRIDKNVLMKLRSQSKASEISINTLVNQILKRFVEWDMLEPRVGMVAVAKPVVAELFGKISKEEIVNLAMRTGKDSIRDIALFMKGKLDVDSFISWLELRMKNSSVEMSHSIAEDDTTHTYVIKHDLGENWSLYNKTILELIFNDVLGKRVDITRMSNTILIFKFQY